MVNNTVSSSERIRKMVYASLFASMTAVGAYMVIPVGPVPITLQVLFVFLAGAFLGARWGAASMVVYLLLGIAGLPVFAGGAAGLGVLLGPTGGYLIGFIASAAVIGYLVERFPGKSISYASVYFLAGMIVIYIFGYLQLMYVASLSPVQAFTLGVAPFILFDAIKAIAAAVLFTRVDIEL
ncbi:biotin transport system substrate-specific component [Methanohalophilus levihalophilus]|uniref:biotin transporter BioY n=1 Tax=Methanohalophilus levihalophilus TaxID=1431282 RepID=UPI001AE3F585|nr:biotin transporter BioY [Methanohalophilus levihalophilus]MBP2030064.1 biotin transport system substrate-specific component [Methanohalophilus levihalophilus]